MRKATLALAAAALVGLTGCASVATGTHLNDVGLTDTQTQAVAHVNGACDGLYFLPMFALITGDTDRAETSMAPVTFLSDTCKVDAVVEMVTRAAKARGATKVTDLQSHRTSMYIPPFFWYKAIQVSGNAVK